MNKKHIVIFILLCCVVTKEYAQYATYENASFGLVVGHSGYTPNMLEVGVGYQPWDVEGQFVSYPFAGFLALYEHSINSRLYGFSLNAWYLSGLISCGLGFNRYSDFVDEIYGVKPMIGVSLLRIGIMYGYNFILNNNSIKGMSQNSLTIKYYLPLWKRKE